MIDANDGQQGKESLAIQNLAREQALVWVLCARCETRVAKPRDERRSRESVGLGWRGPPHSTLSRLRRSSRGFTTRVSHLAHKTQTRACSQAIQNCQNCSHTYPYESASTTISNNENIQRHISCNLLRQREQRKRATKMS